MTRFAALLTKNPGDPFGLTNYTQLKTDHDYLVVAGADLASAGTLTITSEFHGVTGTTTVTNITDASGAAAGQQVRLWIKGGPLTIQNNGGGAGNIWTAIGKDTTYPTNAVVSFVYDGTVWREAHASLRPGAELDNVQITAPVNTGTSQTASTATTAITGNSFVCDGSKILIEAFSAGWPVAGGGGAGVCLYKDGTLLTILAQSLASPSAGTLACFDTPAAGSHQYTLKIFSSFTSAGTLLAGTGTGGAVAPAYLRATKAA